MSIQHAIQQRSYFIWLGEGRPHGRSLDHWLMAEAELDGQSPGKPKAARAKRAVASPVKAAPATKPAAKRAVSTPAERAAPGEA